MKESNSNAHPKAVNIIRPTQSFSVKRFTQPMPPIPNNKPRVARSAKINVDEGPYGSTTTGKKPQLNIYHPPPKRSQSQRPTTLSTSDSQRQQQRSNPRPVSTMTTTTAKTGSKPSFEVYKPPIKQTLARSRTTSVLPSATSSTPISISNHFQRHHQQKQHQQQQRRPSAQTPSTHTQSSLARSVTHHSLSTSSSYNVDGDHSSASESSDESSDDESSDVLFKKHQSLIGSHTDSLATDAALETNGGKGANSSDEQAGEDEDEDSVVNEARVNRKVADLEISNRSLLAVNEMLEMTVRRQASQVAQLKQQITQDGTVEVKPFVSPIEQSETDTDEEWEKDEFFHRLRQMTEKMIESGEASLQFQCGNLGGRVLSHYGQSKEDDSDNDDDYDSYGYVQVSEEEDEVVEKGESEEEVKAGFEVQNAIVVDQGKPYQNPDGPSSRQQQDEISGKRSIGRSNTPRRRFYYSESITWQPK
ncbi:hypothetical protein BDB00DRAFT_820372 [Zychaea mexicana]|uniref:uncharacterized protein n=1 Tax=Zychaea mexicana TaxID=64656 RepID=UPI0022FE6373|nr:uncharacterized protein BDB00DRAFT_820372 [Zychaea mexicana]KAI9493999.1 hypothetical protein BDB00DRAFT_820372 [Zychaea mexicana]